MDISEQLILQDVFAFFICLIFLIRFIVLPAHDGRTLSTSDVPDDVFPRSHAALFLRMFDYIVHLVEEVCFTVLAPERLAISEVIV